MKKYSWNKRKFAKNILTFLGIALLAFMFDAIFLYAFFK